MGFLLKYWYVILAAFVLSMGSAMGLLWLQRGEWIPKPPPAVEVVEGEVPGMSPKYSEWNYRISAVEDIRIKLEAEREGIKQERNELEILQKRVQSEIDELEQLRTEILQVRDAINADYIEIEEVEQENIKQLAKVYTEMKPDAAVTILSALEIELVVKILSEMNEEPASRILAEMAGNGGDTEQARMASQITQLMQLLK